MTLAQESPIDGLAAEFASAKPEYSPVPIWWWSGDRLERERLRWQMEQLVEGGVHNVVVMNLAPTSPLFGADADDPLFMSEDWWAIFLGMCADARDIGMRVWFYDQLGFSGANLQGEIVRDESAYAGQEITSMTVEGSGSLQLECPAEGLPLAAYWTALDDVGNTQGTATAVPLTGRTATVNEARNKRLRLVYAVWRGFDYYNVDGCARLLTTVHYEFERRASQYFGDVIVGSFQDELPTLLSWSADFAARFQELRGYNLLDHMSALFEGDDPESERIRVDYHQVRASLAEEAFFKPLFNWHEKHGLLCGFDQQGPARGGEPISTVKTYANYLQTHRWFSVPGSDHHGDAKIHSSLAHLYDRPRVWIEAFHSSGWGSTLEETFDWLLPWLRAGATLYDPHAVYYSTHGAWWEWAAPSTCWRQPYWKHYRVFADAVSRLCYLLSQGHHICDIGVLFPSTTVQAGLTLEGPLPSARQSHEAYLALTGKMKFLETVVGILDTDRRDFDILDDDSVQRGQAEEGRLQIGAESYRAIILPACQVIEAATVNRLLEFVDRGGLLIAIGELPNNILHASEGQAARLHVLFESGQAVHLEKPDDVVNILSQIPRVIDAPVPCLHRNVDGTDIVFVPAAYPNATQSDSTQWHYAQYDFDMARYHRPMQVVAQGFKGTPQLWNPLTGQREAVPSRPRDDGSVEITLHFDTAPAAVLVWGDNAPTVAMTSWPSDVLMQLPEEWSCTIEQTMDNRYGDLDKPDYAGAPPVQTWQFDHHLAAPEEDNLESVQKATNWTPVEASFGTYGWITGVQPIAEMPSPLQTISDERGLAVEGWQPAVYSLQRGIRKDDLHVRFLGPKSHVPEEFLRFDPLHNGEGVQFRTTVWMPEDIDLHFALGAAADKSLWINGEAAGESQEGYLWLTPVHLKAGLNLIEWRISVENLLQPTVVRKSRFGDSSRAYWTLVTDPAQFKRPERIVPQDDPAKDSLLAYSLNFEIDFEPIESKMHVLAAAACRVMVNGVEIGRQGDFEPYDTRTRVQLYPVSNFRKGQNSIELRVVDYGPADFSPADGVPKELNGQVAVMLDGLVLGTNGESQSIISGLHWHVHRDDQPAAPVTLYRTQWMDPAWTLLWRRPHPLPESDWLDNTPRRDAVLLVTPDAWAGQPRAEWFRWTLPPGATEMQLPVAGDYQLWIDGESISPDDDTVRISRSDSALRTAYLRVTPQQGCGGGAVFTAPVRYTLGPGRIMLGNWAELGLQAYSGGIRYQTSFALDTISPKLTLDLGPVRGTAEVWLNGKRAGLRCWTPYQFDISAVAQAGSNSLEILVLNTLGPYIESVSPTTYVRDGQTISGMMGPVTLRAN